MSGKIYIFLLVMFLTVSTLVSGAFEGEQTSAQMPDDVASKFSRNYLMEDAPGQPPPPHFSQGGTAKWRITIYFEEGRWTGRGQGVNANGNTACTDASTCSSLSGNAQVNGCNHTINVEPMDADNFNDASTIEAELGKDPDADCTNVAAHLHSGPIHGGTAHGSDQ